MKNVFTLLTMIVLLSFQSNHAQETGIGISSITACPENEVTLSINVENLINVGAISLYISYDTARLTFLEANNIHPNFQGLMYNAMTLPTPQIGISWTSVNGTDLIAGVLLDMIFYYRDTITTLGFNPGCEITTPDFETININYTDGGVDPLVLITQHPNDISVIQPNPVIFVVESEGGNSYNWQRSINGGISFTDLTNSTPYQGVDTPELHITSTNTLISNTRYRCRITTGNCNVYSNSALLKVIAAEQQQFFFDQGWNSLSSFLDPLEANPEVLFAEILPMLEILVTDDLVFYPAGGINTLGEFDPGKGYAIKLTSSATFTMDGTPHQQNNITIPEGWSTLPILVDCEIDIDTLFLNHITSLQAVKELPGVNLYWPEMGIHTLNALKPGKAYLIKMLNEVEIEFSECD
jgi:hypothetical protein